MPKEIKQTGENSMNILEMSRKMDNLINQYLKGEVTKEQLEEFRKELNKAMENNG